MATNFGLLVPQGWKMDLINVKGAVEKYETMTRVAQEAERLGYDSVWLYDHFHTMPIPTVEAVFECWTSTAALARDTHRVKIGQMVTCNGYRNPALLAKMASTVDVMSHGRLILGIGAGWYEHEWLGYGFGFPNTRERMRRLAEAVRVIRAMWEQDHAEYAGEYYQLKGAINEPKGVQQPHIPLLIGGSGEQVTLKLVAKFADACNIGGIDPEIYRHKFDILRQHCKAVGRNYDEIQRTAEVFVGFAENDAEAEALTKPLRGNASLADVRNNTLLGNADFIRNGLKRIQEAGAQYFVIYLLDAYRMEPVQRFAEQVMAGFDQA